MCSETAASTWRGCSDADEGADNSDYAAACEVDDFLAVVRRHSAQYLVLGDAPMQTAAVSGPFGVTLVRWVFCPSGDEAARVLAAIPDVLPELEQPVPFELEHAGALLFDSAEEGEERTACIELELPLGSYRVTSESFTGSEFEFVIHRIRRA